MCPFLLACRADLPVAEPNWVQLPGPNPLWLRTGGRSGDAPDFVAYIPMKHLRAGTVQMVAYVTCDVARVHVAPLLAIFREGNPQNISEMVESPCSVVGGSNCRRPFYVNQRETSHRKHVNGPVLADSSRR